jgi:dihydroxyacetone kinase-like protein
MNGEEFVRTLEHMARVIEANKDELCALDSHAGDGDHGVSLTIGMRAARRLLSELKQPTPEAALRAVSEAFADEVGASSGVLYEVGFAAAADAVAGLPTLSRPEDWWRMFDAIARAIKTIGHAEVGDKTMLDAWQPAADALQARRNGTDVAPALAAAADAAWQGVERTKNLIPVRGRASLLGETARGHQDPGATSAWLMIKALHEGAAQR